MSRAPPPRTKTLQCRLTLCLPPGMCAVTLRSLVNTSLATGLLAEFGFLGVTSLVLLQKPFF